MFCFWNGFCLCFSTVLAGVGFCSFFLAGRSFGYFSTIPRMSSGFHYCSFANQLTTIFTIGISAITVFFACGCFFVPQFCMLMSSGRDCLYISFIALLIGTMIRLFSVFYTSSFLCDRSLIPVVRCDWNTLCLCFATCLASISLDTFLGFCCFFCNNTIIPCMTEFIDHCSRFQFCSTITAIDISCIPIFCAGRSFLIFCFFM